MAKTIKTIIIALAFVMLTPTMVEAKVKNEYPELYKTYSVKEKNLVDARVKAGMYRQTKGEGFLTYLLGGILEPTFEYGEKKQIQAVKRVSDKEYVVDVYDSNTIEFYFKENSVYTTYRIINNDKNIITDTDRKSASLGAVKLTPKLTRKEAESGKAITTKVVYLQEVEYNKPLYEKGDWDGYTFWYADKNPKQFKEVSTGKKIKLKLRVHRINSAEEDMLAFIKAETDYYDTPKDEAQTAVWINEYVDKNIEYKSMAGWNELTDVLLDGEPGNCMVYTSAYWLMGRALGLETAYVCGSGGATGDSHAWNAVKVDGKWYEVEPQTASRRLYPLSLKSNFDGYSIRSVTIEGGREATALKLPNKKYLTTESRFVYMSEEERQEDLRAAAYRRLYDKYDVVLEYDTYLKLTEGKGTRPVQDEGYIGLYDEEYDELTDIREDDYGHSYFDWEKEEWIYVPAEIIIK